MLSIDRHPGDTSGTDCTMTYHRMCPLYAFEFPTYPHPAKRPQSTGKAHRTAFTLIELIVVVAIVALLVAILLPSLSKAREQARMVTCKSNLHQIGTAITTYAHRDGKIPFGPNVDTLSIPSMSISIPGNDGSTATNQIWTGPQNPVLQFMAVGLLMTRALAFPELLYCPSDDSSDPEEELAKIRQTSPEPAYTSYMYRQLDETDGCGRIENLGKNAIGRKARVLALDMNSVVTVAPEYYRTNHKARKVNILYLDGSVLDFHNDRHQFSLRDQDLADTNVRLDAILQKGDAG